MSCNAPINIVKNEAQKCSLKCLLWYKYGNSSCTVTNKSDQLLIQYDGDSDVMFNSIQYNPIEIRIFMPSIHTFDGVRADAEIVIVHSGSNGGLLVCIPVTSSSNSNASTGSNLLDDIVSNAPNQKESTSLNLHDFNMNYVIPKSSYFSYTGTLPYGTCDPSILYNYVVFPNKSMVVHKETIKSLGGLIHDSYITTQTGTCYWNKLGTTNNGFSGDGQIYIDCQPTGEEGEILYKEKINDVEIRKFNVDWVYALLYIIVGAILMYLGVKIFKFIIYVVEVSNQSKLNK